MKAFWFLAFLAVPAVASSAEPPSKKSGGFFGFGAPQGPQISSALFPSDSSPVPGEVPSSASADGIFRGGKPQPPAAVSYVIEKGRRIERPVTESQNEPATAPPATLVQLSAPAEPVAVPATSAPDTVERRRGGFLGFGRKEESSAPAAPSEPSKLASTPVPVAAVPVPTAAPAPAASAPAAEAKPTAIPVASAQPVPAESASVPIAEKSSLASRLPFFGRRKSEEPAATPVPVAVASAEPVPVSSSEGGEKPKPVASVPIAQNTPKPSTAPVSGPTGAASAPSAPLAAPAETTDADGAATGGAPPVVEIRREDSAGVEKPAKPSRDGGILPSLPSLPSMPSFGSLPRIGPPKKDLDLTQAETLITDGQIVREGGGADEKTESASAEGDASTGRQAPQIVNGVKTYSSWDDIEASSSSVADKIINSIR